MVGLRLTSTPPKRATPLMVITGPSGLPAAAVRVLEGAKDADAGDVDRGVLRHDDLAAAQDRHDVDGDLTLGEPGVAHVDLAAAHAT